MKTKPVRTAPDCACFFFTGKPYITEMNPPPARMRWLPWTVLAAYMGVVTALSLTPAQAIPKPPFAVPNLDKAVHFAMYAGVAAILCWALHPRGGENRKLWGIVVTAAGYGFFMELAQWGFPRLHRSFELVDLLANTAGSAACVWGWTRLHKTSYPTSP